MDTWEQCVYRLAIRQIFLFESSNVPWQKMNGMKKMAHGPAQAKGGYMAKDEMLWIGNEIFAFFSDGVIKK